VEYCLAVEGCAIELRKRTQRPTERLSPDGITNTASDPFLSQHKPLIHAHCELSFGVSNTPVLVLLLHAVICDSQRRVVVRRTQ
jgi:hypothetical protein